MYGVVYDYVKVIRNQDGTTELLIRTRIESASSVSITLSEKATVSLELQLDGEENV